MGGIRLIDLRKIFRSLAAHHLKWIKQRLKDDHDNPESLDYATGSSREFPGGWRGWLLALAIMLAVAAVLLLIVFVFSRLVIIQDGSA